uniref:General transcription factor IIF subunit 2 n=1 Tax=Salarias fasciatus TaxID=181472 RepID=A0A672F6V0_SALFA
MSVKHEVNLAGVKLNKGVWLVKVPKYLSQQWKKASDKGEVGKLTIGKYVLIIYLIKRIYSDASLRAPVDHALTMHAVGGQTLAVFSQSNEKTREHGISLEGMVVHRAECKPAVTDNYMKMKRVQVREAVKPRRVPQQLEKAVTTVFKPVANHSFNLEYEKKKKTEGKMVRAERQVVLDMLFSAFERHQYYNMKSLVEITKQPVSYLKEIMREIGTYISKGPHKNTWQLKPEYQHYQAGKDEEEELSD